MLFRLRPDQPVLVRTGQETFDYGDFYAYSKICTHVGCPVSLYEQQTNRVLCPCHQSQFDVTDGARPVFGPATRPLPQLPIELDDEGYFVAESDFIEPVGPGLLGVRPGVASLVVAPEGSTSMSRLTTPTKPTSGSPRWCQRRLDGGRHPLPRGAGRCGRR